MGKHERRTGFRRVCAVLLLLALLGAGTALGLSGYVMSATRGGILDPDSAPPGEADAILVLGCGVRPDGSPTPMLRDRVAMGVALYRAGWSGKLLLSGDSSREGYDEVGTMKDLAVEQGVPEGDILVDPYGLSTYESLYRAGAVFGLERLVIVSQEYHLPRALYLSQALDREAWGVPADTRRYAGQLMRDLREILARDKDFVTALLLPEPPAPAG